MTNARVLVVEDDDVIRKLLIEYLKEHSWFSAEGARDGVEALHRTSQTSYAMVILDLMMPKMSGTDFLDSLHAHISDPSVKPIGDPPAVIVITSTPAADVTDDAIMNRSSLVRAVFRKPIDVSALARFVERTVRG